MLTLGLANFAEREIEMVGGAAQIGQVVSNALDVSRYLLVNEPCAERRQHDGYWPRQNARAA